MPGITFHHIVRMFPDDPRPFGLPFYTQIAAPNLDVFDPLSGAPSGEWEAIGAIQAPWHRGSSPGLQSPNVPLSTLGHSDGTIPNDKFNVPTYQPGMNSMLSLWQKMWVQPNGDISSDAPSLVRYNLLAFKMGTMPVGQPPSTPGSSPSQPPAPVPVTPSPGGLISIVPYTLITGHASPIPGVQTGLDARPPTSPPPLPGPVRDHWGVGSSDFDHHTNTLIEARPFTAPLFLPLGGKMGGDAASTMISAGSGNRGPAMPLINNHIAQHTHSQVTVGTTLPTVPKVSLPPPPPANSAPTIPAATAFTDVTAAPGASVASSLTAVATDGGPIDGTNMTGTTFNIVRGTGGASWTGSGFLAGPTPRIITFTFTPGGNVSGTMNKGGVITNFNVTAPNASLSISGGPPFTMRFYITGTVHIDIAAAPVVQTLNTGTSTPPEQTSGSTSSGSNSGMLSQSSTS